MKSSQQTTVREKQGFDNESIRWFEGLGIDNVPQVGGKNASLGEMIQELKAEGIRVPDGFATTAHAYWQFIEENGLKQPIQEAISRWQKQEVSLAETGRTIRALFYRSEFPKPVEAAIRQAYRELGNRYNDPDVDVATRSSATAEDLPEASFAGQQETFLNISGDAALLEACRKCYASLFTDRAISYREKNGFDHLKVALSVGVQKMVRSDRAGSGVMFSLDTETGFRDVVLINAAWGLGENVVQGTVTPDEYMVFKPLLKKGYFRPIVEKSVGQKEQKMIYASGGSHATRNVETSPQERRRFVLTEEEILELARWAVTIEDHYRKPMDMEWAKDGETGDLYIVQARPETVQSQKQTGTLTTYHLQEKGEVLTQGVSIGNAIATGKVCLIEDTSEMDRFEEGGILVTHMTEPDWVPIIRKASAIVTDTGGRTSHAAIVSREYGIPAIVGCGNATQVLADGQEITVSCGEGDQGFVYEGTLEYETETIRLESVPETRTQVMMNIASPGSAFQWWWLPVDGIGLARMEFIISNTIKVHPLALTRFDEVKDRKVRRRIADLTQGYEDKGRYFVEHLARGMAQIAASRYPEPVLVRTSDFKTNEYASLLGGAQFEPDEENPMLGFRGASRYYSDAYRDGFALECRAIREAREVLGFDNIRVMIPFCRTPEEADQVLAVMQEFGLERGKQDLQIYVMAEIPANVILAKEFAKRFDGFSIGSNDLTQLVLGVDRDSTVLSHLFDETHPAVKAAIRELIEKAHEAGVPVGICGQAPSDHPDFAGFLVECGIDSISLNPDSVLPVKQKIAAIEAGGEKPR